MNPLFAISEIQSFLGSFPSKSRRRGKHYFAANAVAEVICVKPDREYAALVSGGEDYEVAFEYDPEDHSWAAECTCPVTYECKHIYAAMLALQANAAKLCESKLANGKSSRKARQKPATVTLRSAPQPPASPLSTALTQSLGRMLDRTEVDYVQRIQWLYHQACSGHTITANAMNHLAPALQDYGWQPLELWPDLPRDDFHFWLYCAWELRKRGLSIPQFMQTVTDFSVINP